MPGLALQTAYVLVGLVDDVGSVPAAHGAHGLPGGRPTLLLAVAQDRLVVVVVVDVARVANRGARCRRSLRGAARWPGVRFSVDDAGKWEAGFRFLWLLALYALI